MYSNKWDIYYLYGDPKFIFQISKYFIGPELQFSFKLLNNTPFGDNITLPIIKNQIDYDSNIHSIPDNLEDSNVIITRFRDEDKNEPMISFIFIEKKFVSAYIYRLSNMEHYKTIKNTYSHSWFIDSELIGIPLRYLGVSNIYYLLSKEKGNSKSNYTVYIFSISNLMFNYIEKHMLSIPNMQLRESNPMVELNSNVLTAYIDKSELMVYFINRHSETDFFTLKLSK